MKPSTPMDMVVPVLGVGCLAATTAVLCAVVPWCYRWLTRPKAGAE